MTGKSRAAIIILAVLLLLLAVAGYAGWRHYTYYDLTAAAPGESVGMEIVIPAGAGAPEIADILYEAGIITKTQYFLNYCRAQGLDSRLKAGDYALSPGMMLDDIAAQIAGGRIVNYKLTVPEGFTLAQIGELMTEKGLCTAQEWNEAILQEWDYPWLAGSPAGERHLEGYLYPETYLYVNDSDVYDLIDMMLAQFQAVWEQELAAEAAAQGMSVHEAVTIAALIERERMNEEECRTISGVIHNRLERGMLLQIDASVLY
ncbi:MAG: endolytic transglycosylase MltG, partial [Syntrophomonadaceae bacterium]|nr:endolytic transglycosylase MltG [Syntrophomonadaceae bacterium]